MTKVYVLIRDDGCWENYQRDILGVFMTPELAGEHVGNIEGYSNHNFERSNIPGDDDTALYWTPNQNGDLFYQIREYELVAR